MKLWKKVLAVVLFVIAVFLIINIVWYIGRENKYSDYSKGMNESMLSTFLTPRYDFVDEEGFTYGVKYPDYLSNTGNLSVAFPAVDDNPYTDGLIVWIDGKKYEYGVILYDNENQYMVEIDESGNELNEEDHAVVEDHKENIILLLNKAKKYWNLKVR